MNTYYTCKRSILSERILLISGVLLLPVFGLGLLLLVYAVLKYQRTFYEINDSEIRVIKFNKMKLILLADIKELKISTHWGGFKELHIISNGTHVLTGIVGVERVTQILEEGIHRSKKRLSTSTLVSNKVSQPNLFSDKMNDLVGMWQQGLITNDEFKEEKQKFT